VKLLISIDPLTPFEVFDLVSDLYWSFMLDIEMRSLDSPILERYAAWQTTSSQDDYIVQYVPAPNIKYCDG
jgi:hypothetical protein